MRLQSVSVRNYRIHKDLTIDLDPSRNLIGGVNESGKSTLIEAIHRALFLKASTGGVLQKGMVSDTHSGHPEVDVTFEIKGKTYKIAKRFSGTSGTATLNCEGEETLSGSEAEEKLAELLGVDFGKLTKATLKGRWSHLWVWQGSGGADPSEHATQEKDSLLARLKDQGGGAAMQSDLDGRVTAFIADLFSKNYTDGGKIRAGSPLSDAGENKETAQEDLDSARERLEQLSTAISTYESASQRIQESEQQATQISDQIKEARESLAKAEVLSNQAKVERPAFEQKEKEYRTLQQADSVIEKLCKNVAEEEQTTKGQADKIKALEEAGATLREQFTKANKEVQTLDDSLREAGNRSDLADAFLRLKELSERQSQLKKTISEISGLEQKKKEREVELAKLPQIDAKTLEELQTLSFAVSEAKTALDAMSTGIEIIESDATVLVGDDELGDGNSTVINENTEIQIGKSTRLKISPGGGTGLAEARSNQADCIRDFQEKLDRLGISSLDEAREHSLARQKLEVEIQSISAELTGKDAVRVEEENNRTAKDLEAVRADVKRRSKMIAGEFSEPKDSAAARLLVAEMIELFEQAERDFKTAVRSRDTLEKSARKAEDAFAKDRKSFDEEKQKLSELQTRLKVLQETSGNDEERGKKLKLLKSARDEAKEKLKLTESGIAEMEPDKHREDLERFSRALDGLESQRGQAKEERAVAHEKLRSDGSQDLNEALRKAEAGYEFASEQFLAVERKAAAIKLLKEMFAEEQRALADQFTGPLVQSISAYLECVFGPGSSAAINLEEGEFKGLKLIRSGETVEFDSLSGGTREQVAAAVRLAMAEILVGENDGSLPLVFDDAFANSDPERIQSLQRMLDLGARNGLQIILLSCDAGRYAGFGAKTRILTRNQ